MTTEHANGSEDAIKSSLKRINCWYRRVVQPERIQRFVKTNAQSLLSAAAEVAPISAEHAQRLLIGTDIQRKWQSCSAADDNQANLQRNNNNFSENQQLQQQSTPLLNASTINGSTMNNGSGCFYYNQTEQQQQQQYFGNVASEAPSSGTRQLEELSYQANTPPSQQQQLQTPITQAQSSSASSLPLQQGHTGDYYQISSSSPPPPPHHHPHHHHHLQQQFQRQPKPGRRIVDPHLHPNSASNFTYQGYYGNYSNSFDGTTAISSQSLSPMQQSHNSLPVSPQASPTNLRRMFAQSGYSTYDAWMSNDSNYDQYGWYRPSSPYLSPPSMYHSPEVNSVASPSLEIEVDRSSPQNGANNRVLLGDLRGHRSDDLTTSYQAYYEPEHYFYRFARSYEEEPAIIDLSTKCRQVAVSAEPTKEETTNLQDQSQNSGDARCSVPVDVCKELWSMRSNFAERCEFDQLTDDGTDDMVDSSMRDEALDLQKKDSLEKQLLQLPSEEGAKRQQAFRRLWSSRSNAIGDQSIDSIESASLSERGYECTATSFDSNADNVVQERNKKQTKASDSAYKSMSVEHSQKQISDLADIPSENSSDSKNSRPLTLEIPDYFLSTTGSSFDLGLAPGSPKRTLMRQEPVMASPDMVSPANSESATSSKKASLSKLGQSGKQDSFDDPNMPYYITKPAVFARLLRMKARNPGHSQSSYHQTCIGRDFSIDNKTNKIFQDFVKYDPSYERRSSLPHHASPTNRPYRPHSLRFHRHDRPGSLPAPNNKTRHSVEDMTQRAKSHEKLGMPVAEPMMTMSWATQGPIAEEESTATTTHQLPKQQSMVTNATSGTVGPWFITPRSGDHRRTSNPPPARSMSQQHSPSLQRQSTVNSSRNIPVICLPDGAKYN